MNKKYLFIIIIVGGLGGLAYFLTLPPTTLPIKIQKSTQQKSWVKSHTVGAKNKVVDNHAQLNKLDQQQVSALEIEKSLRFYAKVFKEFAQGDRGREFLLEQLRSVGLHPEQVVDKNEYTGALTIVRTKNSLPGVRYFHAQFFSGANSKPYMQHLSFDLMPGKNALEHAIKMVAPKRDPDYHKGDFYSWNLKSGYNLWIKKQSYEDLQDDPFNAYEKSDAGTIRVAIELPVDDE